MVALSDFEGEDNIGYQHQQFTFQMSEPKLSERIGSHWSANNQVNIPEPWYASPVHDVMPYLPIRSPYSGEKNVQAIHGQEEINDSGSEGGEHDMT